MAVLNFLSNVLWVGTWSGVYAIAGILSLWGLFVVYMLEVVPRLQGIYNLPGERSPALSLARSNPSDATPCRPKPRKLPRWPGEGAVYVRWA